MVRVKLDEKGRRRVPDARQQTFVANRVIVTVGEALDVDGDCGGFNLMFAFAGGLLVGCSATK